MSDGFGLKRLQHLVLWVSDVDRSVRFYQNVVGLEVKRKYPNAAFMKAMTPSPALAAIVGDKPLPRTEVTKKVWEYIKKNKLQDAKNRRMINADDALKTVFGGKKQVSMFEMTKMINGHLK